MVKLFFIFLLLIILGLSLKASILKKRYENLNKYISNYLKTIISARYGNLNEKCEQGADNLTSQLSKNTNALLESIVDRDKMINEYIEKEKESTALKEDFITSLTHDLKVPIIAQDNTYDLFLNGTLGELSEIQKHAIENLKISNNDLKNLILDLLDAHKLEQHELTLNLEEYSLNELIKEVIEQNKSILMIRGKNINFIQNKEITHKIDVFLFKRVLNNLISNAIFYGKNSKNIDIILEQKDKNVEISVIDEGEGIKENPDEIFKKYYTNSKKYSNTGIGLGLYIANKIILSHKGKITASNTKDKGACFKIVL